MGGSGQRSGGKRKEAVLSLPCFLPNSGSHHWQGCLPTAAPARRLLHHHLSLPRAPEISFLYVLLLQPIKGESSPLLPDSGGFGIPHVFTEPCPPLDKFPDESLTGCTIQGRFYFLWDSGMQTLGLPILQMMKEARPLETASLRLHEWLKAEHKYACSQCPWTHSFLPRPT